MFACKLDDLQLQIRHGCQHELLALHFDLEPADLLREGAQEKQEPWLQIGKLGSNRGLSLAQRQVIRLLAFLDHALQGAVGHVGVTRLQKQQGGDDP